MYPLIMRLISFGYLHLLSRCVPNWGNYLGDPMNHDFRLHNLARHLVYGKLAHWFIFYIFLSTQSCTPSNGWMSAGRMVHWTIFEKLDMIPSWLL